MNIGPVLTNNSTFLSIEKDCKLIVEKMLKNENLKRLLFHPTETAIDDRALTQEETIGLLNKNIKITPTLGVDPDLKTYIILGFDNFVTNSNPAFRDNTISFDIICHYDLWSLGDYKLRPYKIMGEIDGMFNNTHLTGIGTLNFIGAQQLMLNEEYGGFSILFSAQHGGEDYVEVVD